MASYFRPKLADGREPVITIRHLLTDTAGFTYGFLEPEGGPYHRLGVSDGLDAAGLTLEKPSPDRIRSAALRTGRGLGLSVVIDVLGAVIERVTGATLPEAVRRFVTGPLGVSSVAFVRGRRCIGYALRRRRSGPNRMTEPFAPQVRQSAIVYSPARAFDAKAFPSGGVGMVEPRRTICGSWKRSAPAARGSFARKPRPPYDQRVRDCESARPDLASAGGSAWRSSKTRQRRSRRSRPALGTGLASYGTNFWVDPVAGLSVVALTNTAVAGMTGSFPMALRDAVYAG